MEQLQQLKQSTIVDSYINGYESWMQVMKRGRAYLPWTSLLTGLSVG
jgi:hypothetical protein